MATLENRTKLLGDEALVWQVLSLHSRLFAAAPISPTAGKSQPIPAYLSTVSTSASDALDSAGIALTSPAASRKHSLDSSRALFRVGTSMKSMLGSMRKLIRSEKSISEEGNRQSSESVSAAGSVPSWHGLSVL